jgi:hypothetical protein
MTRQAANAIPGYTAKVEDPSGAVLEFYNRFAELVAQHEREACARVCELMWHEWLDSPEENEPNKPDAEDCYRAIRARGHS